MRAVLEPRMRTLPSRQRQTESPVTRLARLRFDKLAFSIGRDHVSFIFGSYAWQSTGLWVLNGLSGRGQLGALPSGHTHPFLIPGPYHLFLAVM